MKHEIFCYSFAHSASFATVRLVDGERLPDPAGKAVLEGEACKAFVPGITTGWETLEKAAEQLSIL